MSRLTEQFSHAGSAQAASQRFQGVPLAEDAAADQVLESTRLAVRFNAAREIRQRRIRLAMSQEALAARLGIRLSELIAIEVGEADVLLTLDACERLRTEESERFPSTK